jgi:hypothetical protein
MHDEPPSEKLLSQYIQICNAALAANKNRFPYKQILSAAQQQQNNKQTKVGIIDNHPTPRYAIKIKDNHISYGTCSDLENGATWFITKSYIEEVLQNPDDYIKNPAKLDWEWLLPSKPEAY